VFQNGCDSLPSAHQAVPAEWNYSTPRALGHPRLDNCFSGWDGKAEIRSGSGEPSLRIEADAIFGNLVVYVPDGRDFFAIEPVSHSSDAINRPDSARNGLAVLRPGETMLGVVRFRVGAPAP
jgi:aldose 1-epimerase